MYVNNKHIEGSLLNVKSATLQYVLTFMQCVFVLYFFIDAYVSFNGPKNDFLRFSVLWCRKLF